jgi:hypothetical protein
MTTPIARRLVRAVAAMAVLAAASAAYAHHSFAMFDSEHQIKIKGKVTDFQWQNPHVYIEIDAQDVNAKEKITKSWTIECANPGILNRIGWKFNMVKVGDELTLIVAPLRSGEPGALLKQITLPDGKVFTNGGPAGPANIQ